MKPFPWFWLVRMVAAGAAAVIWGTSHPNAAIWQLFLAGIIGTFLADDIHEILECPPRLRCCIKQGSGLAA